MKKLRLASVLTLGVTVILTGCQSTESENMIKFSDHFHALSFLINKEISFERARDEAYIRPSTVPTMPTSKDIIAGKRKHYNNMYYIIATLIRAQEEGVENELIHYLANIDIIFGAIHKKSCASDLYYSISLLNNMISFGKLTNDINALNKVFLDHREKALEDLKKWNTIPTSYLTLDLEKKARLAYYSNSKK